MIAVLVNSRRVGSSARIAVRTAQRIRASGLDGDHVRVHFFGEEGAFVDFHEDGEIQIPSGVHSVVAVHMKCGKGRVFVDLLKAA